MCLLQDSMKEQASQGSFVAHGRQDVLIAAIGRPEHPGHVCVAGASVTIKQYFGLAPRTSCTSSSMALEDLEQLTQKIREAGGVDHKKSDLTTNVVLQLDAIPVSIANKITWTRTASWAWGWSFICSSQHKEELCWSLRERPRHGWLSEIRVVRQRKSSPLVALGRHYEGSKTVHKIPLGNDQVKVGVEEVRDADAHIPVPTQEVQLVGQALNTFVAWVTHLVKCFLEQVFHYH